MGKNGENNGTLDKDMENADPNLPVIGEEDHEVKHEDDGSQKASNKSPKTSLSSSVKRESMGRSILKLKSVPNTSATSKTLMITDPKESTGKLASVTNAVDHEEYGEMETPGGKKAKEKKGKKAKKGKKDEDGNEDEDKKPKKGKTVSLEELKSDIDVNRKQSKAEETKVGKKGKKNKKEKVEKGEQTDEPEIKEKKEKKGKAKKQKLPKESKGTQKDTAEEETEFDNLTRSETKLRSRVSFHQSKQVLHRQSKSSTGKQYSATMVHESERGKRHKENASKTSIDSIERISSSLSPSRMRMIRKASLRQPESLLSTGRRIRRWISSSGFSTDTDEFSTDSSEGSARVEKEERGKKKKKGKNYKKGQRESKEMEPETEEDIERKKAEKLALLEAKKAEKKAAKLAAKKAKKEATATSAAPATQKAEKTTAMEYDDVKKKLDEMLKYAKELGVEELVEDKGEEKGPKKKMSKKEKARLTAEMAEKQKMVLEAETKRIEELIKKKKEEERLAAIERDKKDIIEQGMRMEQLRMTGQLIEGIMKTNADIAKKEKDLLEWQKYLECGYLPNPVMVNQMNTYLHLWELILEQTSIEVASKKTTDAIKLLNDLDEIIDTVTKEDECKLANWRWVRQLFREYQASSLDVATYRLIRDVEHNLNRINIPTADFNFQDDNVTLCIWLRVMLPIPLPNPRRPPKPRIDVFFKLMDLSVLFPYTIDCQDAAIRAMYLKYDHLSDLCNTFDLPEVPKDYHMDLLEIANKEWRSKLIYKYDNRDKITKQRKPQVEMDVADSGSASPEQHLEHPEQNPEGGEADQQFDSDEEIPIVPFKQLKPTASEYAVEIEDKLYVDTRKKLTITVPEHVLNLRKFVILGGVYHLHLLGQPPQPQDFVTMEMTITGLYLPKKLEVLPFKVVYTPYIPPEPEPVPPGASASFTRKLPEEIEEEIKKQEEELDKLISINIKWPQHVIFLELPIVCRWDEDLKQWSKEEIHDLKHNEEKCILSFRTGVFGIYALATYRYVNLPFQAYDIKPETDESITVQLTAAILMLEFNIKNGLISITQLQNSPNMTLQKVVGKYFKLHQLIRMMKEAGIDIFPAFDAFCYVDGCCEKQWAMEKHLYYNMAQMSNSFNFAWSRWNLQTDRRKIVVQMRQYAPESKKQKSHQMLLVSPRKACYIECTEVSQTFSTKEVESTKFCADLYHLMKSTNGIFVRNKIMKACKQNVHTVAQFLSAIRVMSFS